ncbi:Neuroglobin [Amphibalanus amphitrite]|uniref:Neuroglobin n=1 Tax=Amphibalanus amphitrite TaxID=1232801 RepID=A0A6A4WGC2_AMPAM|nr:neuroglobin-like [Amphibalanus amphitrite]KAF0301078.1 Neuroglobin [Amphibalanus amphitrite]
MGGGVSRKGPLASERGSVLRSLPPPLPKDPRLPLTIRQKFSIVKSWKGISRTMEPTGIYMFVKLFEDHAELINFFEKFRQLRSRDAQAESLELAEHASIVMNSLDEGIKALEDMDYFFSLLHQIGGAHTRVPGFKKEFFWKIKNPFLEAVKATLGDAYTSNMDNIYRLTIDFIISTVIEGFDRAAKARGGPPYQDTDH